MFGNKASMTEEQVEEKLRPLEQRIAELEKVVEEQAVALQSLHKILNEQNALMASLQARGESGPEATDSPAEKPAAQPAGQGPVRPQQQTEEPSVRFFSMPTADGAFAESTAQEQVGKSIYRMTTVDGRTGRFTMLSTPDAIATAMISVSQFVKPVCRIEGNTRRQPQHIDTLDEGLVQFEAGVWRVVRKATVQFV